jgi:ankyrin repeat protein
VASAGETLSVFDPQQLRFFDLQVVLAKEGASLNERLRRPSGDGPLAATGEYVMFGAHRTGLLHLSSSHVQSVLPMLDEKLGPSPNTEIGSDGIKLPWRINDYVADRGVFWMATPDRVIWYDPQNDACGQLPFPVTRGAVVIAADGDRVWAACSEERHPGLRGVGAQTVVMLGDRTESRWLGGFTLAGAVRAMAVTSNRVWFGRDGCENKLVEVDKRACYQLAGAQNADDKARFARPSVLAMQTGSTAVMQAAYLGDGEALEKLLMDGKQNERAAGQWSPLLSAVRSGDHAVVHRLLQQSDMARARTAPLEIAAEMGWVDLLEFLVQTGGGGMKLSTALAKAVEQGHAQAADFLLKQGASGAKDAIGENLTHRHGYGNREEHSESALVAAIEASDVDSVKVLLRHGMDPNQPGWSKLRRTAPPLRIAVGVGSLPIAQALLQAGADPNAVVDARYSLLSIAAAYGSAEVVKLLMERGARPQGSGSAADDPLTMACFHGRLQVVELLLDAGLDMYHETAWERPTYIHEPIGRKQHSLITTVTPFAAAAMGGWGEVMQLLIDRGLDVNRQTRQGVRQGDLALIRSRQEMLPVLIEMGFDINARDESGRTALIWAVQTQRTDDAQRLLAFGADPTVPNALGQTPVQLTPSAALHALLTQAVQERSGSTGTDRAWVSQHDMGLALRALADAAERGDAEAVEAMLKHHVWPNSQSSDERSALHLAAYEGHLPVVDQLIAAGAAVDMKGPEGWTALMHAAGQGHADVVRCLLNAGAEPLVLNNIGQSAHDIAIQRLHRAAAAELENAGAVVRDGRALIAAACKGQVWKLDWLLKEGANPNAVDERGWTALFYAANGENPPWLGNVSFERNYDVIKLLLACGADVNWRDKNGWTSLMALLGTHFSEGVKLADVQLLLEAGASVNIRDVYGLTPVLFVETSWWMDGELKRSIVAMLGSV